MQPIHASRRILRPVNRLFIAISLLVALLLNLIPFGRLPGIPDWVLLVLTFWCINQPLKVNMGAGFLLGLLMDVVDGSAMGQHALAYVLLAFAASGLSRRILWFPLRQQALHVLPLFLGTQVVMLLVRLVAGAEFPGLLWFLASASSALLWYPLTYLLLLPQFRPEEKDDNRPI
ncbi:MAG: rod shape-determining protein MreD [Betaproteobacteria bacterium HGW-Betaproteobacteria-11]|nr:MAG: rod shape-determining protein MreD [Betaproteobacteria bacterium HGW-Betaproteobacteria-11]